MSISIPEITPAQARRLQSQGAVLIDVRDAHERANGQAEGSLGIAKPDLETTPGKYLPDTTTAVLLICQTGGRSMQAAQVLVESGYARVSSIEGGTSRWLAEGLPMVKPQLDAEEADFMDRYSRHLRLPEVGVEGQRVLEKSRVLMIGAGGLGSPAAYYLAAAGVGQLRIADDDVVERSNLQRQILHTEARLGEPKVESARQALSALNPRTRIEAVSERVTAANIERLLEGVDVVLDGADNFPVRYLVNDACVKLG